MYSIEPVPTLMKEMLRVEYERLRIEKERLNVAREINYHLQNLDVLDARRKKNAKAMYDKRHKKANVCTQENVYTQKEEGTEREELPPTPPIGEKGKGEEGSHTHPACAREDVCSSSADKGGQGAVCPTLDEVSAFCAANKLSLDPAQMVLKIQRRPDEWAFWQSTLLSWDKNQCPYGRKAPTEDKKPKQTKDDLTAERLAKCKSIGCKLYDPKTGKCRWGVTQPPPNPKTECLEYRKFGM